MERHQKSPEDLDELLDLSRWSYFSVFGGEADQVRERLDPQLCRFLESIIVPEDEENSELFVWVQGVAAPEEMQNDEILQVFEAEDQQTQDGVTLFALLYPMNMNLASHPLGVVYHQELRRVAFVNTIFDAELVNPPDEHEDLWVPLEHLLSHWISLIQRGKVTIGPKRWEMEEAQGVWRIEAFGNAQVTSTVEAFDRLVSAIEQRMDPQALLDLDSNKPLLTDADLDSAGASAECFARSFLTRARTPRFTRLAPGIEVPHDAAAFASHQKFTRLQHQPEDEDDNRPIIPPVLMFASSEGHTVNFDSDDQYVNKNPFPTEMHLAAGDHSTPAGLYCESVKLGVMDIAGEGFSLLLPFSLQGGEGGAKMSDGLPVNQGSVSDLFQHGTFPLGGRKRSQRLERLFDTWTALVERGVWSVGNEGVEGSYDKFRDADNGSWSDYWIAPDTAI